MNCGFKPTRYEWIFHHMFKLFCMLPVLLFQLHLCFQTCSMIFLFESFILNHFFFKLSLTCSNWGQISSFVIMGRRLICRPYRNIRTNLGSSLCKRLNWVARKLWRLKLDLYSFIYLVPFFGSSCEEAVPVRYPPW